MTDKKQKTGLDLLREAFPANQISKLPKPTKRQTDEVKADFKAGVRCADCGGWHHPKVQHVDYVGHAALTDRLLDCDPNWNWEPVATAENGVPIMDSIGGMWIRLTVCDFTRLGYGFADGKVGGNAIKETIGDALRNAAMRFGAALDLWHKGELHAEAATPEDGDGNNAVANPPKSERAESLTPPADDPFAGDDDQPDDDKDAVREIAKIATITDMDELGSYWKVLNEVQKHIAKRPDVIAAKDERKAVIGGKEAA